MEYQEFKEELKKELRKSFPDYFVEEPFEDHITVRVPEKAMGPSCRVKELYKERQEVDRELMEILIRNIQYAIENMPEVDRSILKDFENAKDKIFPVLIPAEKVRDNAISEVFTDGIRCGVRLNIGGGTSLCTKEMCREWGVTEEEVLKAAKGNTKGENAGIIQDVCQKIASKLPEDDIMGMLEMEPSERMYVIETQRMQFGASAILQPGVQKELEKIFGSRFVILPSSIHEVLVVKYTDDLETYKEMVVSANLTDIREEDFLSNNVLVYENGEIREV